MDKDALSTRGGDGVNHDKDLPDKDVAEGHVDDDNVGQGTDRDGLQDALQDDKDLPDKDEAEGCVDDDIAGRAGN